VLAVQKHEEEKFGLKFDGVDTHSKAKRSMLARAPSFPEQQRWLAHTRSVPVDDARPEGAKAFFVPDRHTKENAAALVLQLLAAGRTRGTAIDGLAQLAPHMQARRAQLLSAATDGEFARETAAAFYTAVGDEAAAQISRREGDAPAHRRVAPEPEPPKLLPLQPRPTDEARHLTRTLTRTCPEPRPGWQRCIVLPTPGTALRARGQPHGAALPCGDGHLRVRGGLLLGYGEGLLAPARRLRNGCRLHRRADDAADVPGGVLGARTMLVIAGRHGEE
jgi:hypothetical protein